ncbi:hypothetical protein MTO96_039825 [Rhipicephalus appendiculatus]
MQQRLRGQPASPDSNNQPVGQRQDGLTRVLGLHVFTHKTATRHTCALSERQHKGPVSGDELRTLINLVLRKQADGAA